MVRLPGMPEITRKVIARDPQAQLVHISIGPCMVCGQNSVVWMPEEAWTRYDNGHGEYIQNAWPQGTAAEREQLINGTHPKCFNELFPPDEE